jgi:hypothetical protein
MWGRAELSGMIVGIEARRLWFGDGTFCFYLAYNFLKEGRFLLELSENLGFEYALFGFDNEPLAFFSFKHAKLLISGTLFSTSSTEPSLWLVLAFRYSNLAKRMTACPICRTTSSDGNENKFPYSAGSSFEAGRETR